MLSQDKFDKINERDVFKHEVVLDWLPSYKRDEPYWSNNWIFTPSIRDGKIMMVDTHNSEFRIELTDENFDGFVFLFDKDNVKTVNNREYFDYDEADRFHVPLGTEGWRFCKTYLVKKDAKKNYDLQMERLQYELASAQSHVRSLENQIAQLKEEHQNAM